MSSIYFEATYDDSRLRKGLIRSNLTVAEWAKSFQHKNKLVSNSISEVRNNLLRLASVGFGVKLTNDIIKVRGEFQQLGIAFETMLGSKTAADKLMQEAIVFAQKTPFTLTDVATNIKQLMAMGIETEKVMDTMKALGDVAAGVSVPISRIAINYGQVAALGRLQQREIRDFAMAGIPIVEELANQLGKSSSEINDMVQAGKIGFPEVEQAFASMAGEGGKFYNLMEKQNASVTGQISNLQDKIQVMLNSIGQANEGLIYGGISGIANLVENYEKVIDVLQVIAITYGTYKAAVIAVNAVESYAATVDSARLAIIEAKTAALQKEMIMNRLSGSALVAKTAAANVATAAEIRQYMATNKLTAAQALLNRTMLANPYVLAAVGAGLLITALVKFNSTAREAAKLEQELNDQVSDQRAKIESLVTIIKSETSSLDDKKKAIKTLNEISPEYLGNLNLQNIATNEGAKAIDNYVEALTRKIKAQQLEKQISESIAREEEAKAGRLTISQKLRLFGGGRAAGAAQPELIKDIVQSEQELQKELKKQIESLFSDGGLTSSTLSQTEKQAKQTIETIKDEIGRLTKELEVADESDRHAIAEKIVALQKELGLREQIVEESIKAVRNQIAPGNVTPRQSHVSGSPANLGLSVPTSSSMIIDWISVFGRIEQLSTDALVALRDKLKKYLSEIDDDISKEDFKEIVDAFESINEAIETRKPVNTLRESVQDYKNQTKKIEALKEQLKYYKEQGGDLLKIAKIENQILEAENGRSKSLSKINKAINEIGKQGSDLVGAIGDFTGMLENFGVDIGEQGKQILGGVGQIMDGIASIDTNKPFSIVTGAIEALAGIGNVVASLLGGVNSELSQDVFDRYQDLMSTMDEVISKQKELLDAMAGQDAVNKSNEAVQLINKQIEATRTLGKEWLNSGASWKSHSHGFDLMKDLKPYAAEFKKIGIDFEKLDKRVTGLFELSPDQLQTIKTEVPEAWARIDDQTRKYLETIIEGGEQLEGMKDQLNEVLTDLSFDQAKDALKDLLMDADATMSDVANNFENYMKKAIVGMIVDGSLKDLVQQWYVEFSKAMADGELSKGEKESLGSMYNNIYTTGTTMRNAAYSAAGFESSPASSSSSGLVGSIRRDLTEETGGELAGILRKSSDDTRMIRDYTKDGIDRLISIESNTYRTAIATENSVAELKNAVSELKTINNNTSPSQSGRDLGL